MVSLRKGCRRTVEALEQGSLLSPEWTCDEATDIFWAMLYMRNWEHLTVECGWSPEQYIERMQTLLKRTLVQEAK